MKKIKGIALISVLLLTVLMVIMAVSMLFISTQHLSIIGNIEGKAKALKAAEAGVEYAIYMLDKNPAWGLDGDPDFQEGKYIEPNDPSTWPKFSIDERV